MAAKEMLLVFLKKSRTRRSVAKGIGAGSTGHIIDIVRRSSCVCPQLYEPNILTLKSIDTVLVKLYAEFEKTTDLYALLQSPNDVSVPEVELVLQRTGQYNALCMLYQQHKDDNKLLDVWAK